MRLAVVCMIVLGLAVALLAEQISSVMTGDEIVAELTVTFVYILAAVQPLMAIEYVLTGALRGAGDTRFPLFVTIGGLIGVRIGLATTFALLEMPVTWISASLIGDYVLKGVMLLWRFQSGRWKYVVRNEDLIQ